MKIQIVFVVMAVVGCGVGTQPPPRAEVQVVAENRRPEVRVSYRCEPLPAESPVLQELRIDGHAFGTMPQKHVYLVAGDEKHEVLCPLDQECLAEAIAAKQSDEQCVNKTACCLLPRAARVPQTRCVQ